MKATERYSTAGGIELTIVSEQSDEDSLDLLDVTVYVNPHGGYDLVDFTFRGLEGPDGSGFRFSYKRRGKFWPFPDAETRDMVYRSDEEGMEGMRKAGLR